MLMDIATEELSHLEIIGSLVGMLNKGAKGALAEGTENEAELYRSLTQNGNDSHITSLLYGGGPALTNSAGVPGLQLMLILLAKSRPIFVQILQLKLGQRSFTNVSLMLLMIPSKRHSGIFNDREAAHMLSFEKALHSIRNTFPPGNYHQLRNTKTHITTCQKVKTSEVVGTVMKTLTMFPIQFQRLTVGMGRPR